MNVLLFAQDHPKYGRAGQIAFGDLQNWSAILKNTFVRIGLLTETSFVKAVLSRPTIMRISIVITFLPSTLAVDTVTGGRRL